jgi:hypothetical protein
MFDEINKNLLDLSYEWETEDERLNGEIQAVELQDENQIDPFNRHVLSENCLCQCETLSGIAGKYNFMSFFLNQLFYF